VEMIVTVFLKSATSVLGRRSIRHRREQYPDALGVVDRTPRPGPRAAGSTVVDGSCRQSKTGGASVQPLNRSATTPHRVARTNNERALKLAGGGGNMGISMTTDERDIIQ